MRFSPRSFGRPQVRDHHGRAVAVVNPRLLELAPRTADHADRHVVADIESSVAHLLVPTLGETAADFAVIVGTAAAAWLATRRLGWGLIHVISVAGLALVGLCLLSFRRRRIASIAAVAAAYTGRGHCASCAYNLNRLPPEPDGCVICPECGAAWRLSRPSGRYA
jgi:hypothetical protein